MKNSSEKIDDIMQEEIQKLKNDIAKHTGNEAAEAKVKETVEAKIEAAEAKVKEAVEAKTEAAETVEAKIEAAEAKVKETVEAKAEAAAAKSENAKSEEPEIKEPEIKEPEIKEPEAEEKPEEPKKPESPEELEPTTVHESTPEIMDDLSASLEKQLDHLVGYPEKEESMDSKIDNAIAQIVNETTGDIPEAAATEADSEKETRKRLKAEKKAEKKAGKTQEKADRQFEKAQEKADRQAEKDQKKAIKQEYIQENSEEYTKKKKKRRTIIAVAASVVALAGIGTYGGFAYHYRDIFFHGTTINGFDCSGMMPSQAEELIRNQVEDYAIQMKFRDGTSEKINGSDIDYKYVSDGSVQRILDNQNPLAWIKGYFSPEDYEVAKEIQFDQNKLKEKYFNMPSIRDESQVAPTDAYVAYQNNSFVVIPETEGNQLDRETLLSKLDEFVSGSHTELNVEEQDVYNHPSVYQDSPELANQSAQLNNLASVNITYVLPQGNKVLDGNEVKSWLSVDEAGNYTITEDDLRQHIKDYVAQLAEETNTVGNDRAFHATLQGDITVSGGNYGWKIDQKSEVAQLVDDIQNHVVSEREPSYSSREVATDNSGFGWTYIEVDLGNQHLWYYVDGELYMQSDFVSGRASMADRKTPGGLYTLIYKQRDRVLRGEKKPDGTYEYESSVKYWMPFNGGIGFHDASWRGSFGGSIYKYGGSHGCINMPTSKAATMYEIIDKNTPVICFY